MDQRTLGRTHRTVSAIGLGTWQLGADWGEVSEEQALDVLAAAVDAGVTLLDTADVYGDGRSEKFIGRFLRDHDGLTVATKMGRRVDQVLEDAEGFRGGGRRLHAAAQVQRPGPRAPGEPTRRRARQTAPAPAIYFSGQLKPAP